MLGANGHMGHEGGRRSGCDRLMRGADRPWTAAAHFSYEGMVCGWQARVRLWDNEGHFQFIIGKASCRRMSLPPPAP